MQHTIVVVVTCLSLVLGWLPWDSEFTGMLTIGSDEPVLGINHGSRSPNKVRRTLPTNKIRGVNLGSLFVMEPWMASAEWKKMGCDNYYAESECVQAVGARTADKIWRDHWNTWIDENDLNLIQSYGLNTIRVPVGWWMLESLVEPGEYFPRGSYPFLERVCKWAAERSLYVIMDLHALPGAQADDSPFTGILVDQAGFYQDAQYQRALEFLRWMTKEIHTNDAFRTVGMLEIANEPLPDQPGLLTEYYPQALQTIRSTEVSLGVLPWKALTVQYMGLGWGAGNPMQHVAGSTNLLGVAFDNHNYLAKSTVAPTQQDYLYYLCTRDWSTDSQPLVIGEWSLATNDTGDKRGFGTTVGDMNSFYKRYWAAQVQSFEKNLGWVFWSWKTSLKGIEWDYRNAVDAGVISKNPADALNMDVCSGVKNVPPFVPSGLPSTPSGIPPRPSIAPACMREVNITGVPIVANPLWINDTTSCEWVKKLSPRANLEMQQAG